MADKSGVLTTAHGIRIACLAGIYDSSTYNADSAHVRSFYSSVAIFLTPHAGIYVSLLHHTYGRETPRKYNDYLQAGRSKLYFPRVHQILLDVFPAHRHPHLQRLARQHHGILFCTPTHSRALLHRSRPRRGGSPADEAPLPLCRRGRTPPAVLGTRAVHMGQRRRQGSHRQICEPRRVRGRAAFREEASGASPPAAQTPSPRI